MNILDRSLPINTCSFRKICRNSRISRYFGMNLRAENHLRPSRQRQERDRSRVFSTSNEITGKSKPLYRIAVVGSGPSAFYATKYLLSQHTDIAIDMFEKQPFPYGLVRYGVAPDHPEVKSVISQFHDLAQQHSQSDGEQGRRFRYFGNVEVSDHNAQALPLILLDKHYSAILLAYGASEDHALHVPGEGAENVFSARSFVNWYNGHPEYQHLPVNLQNIRNVVIVGQGNVALDCARILARNVKELETTDISDASLRTLKKNHIQHIYIVGRRGHVQSAFTIKELRELTKLDGVQVHISAEELTAGFTPASEEEAKQTPSKKRILQLMDTISKTAQNTFDRTIHIRFLLNPKEIVVSQENKITGIKMSQTSLQGEPFKQKAIDTDNIVIIPCDMLLKSIGYKSQSISPCLPFDFRRLVVSNVQGRVSMDIARQSPWYVTGWLKRGPTGIIGTNITDARETVQCILDDIKSDKLKKAVDSWPLIAMNSKQIEKVISWQDYEKLDEEEVRRGEACDPPKPREKIVDIQEAFRVVGY